MIFINSNNLALVNMLSDIYLTFKKYSKTVPSARSAKATRKTYTSMPSSGQIGFLILFANQV